MDWGEVNLTHAYYNGSCTSKDTEDPSWSTSFKTRRAQKTSSALEVLWKTLFVLYLYLIGTLQKIEVEVKTDSYNESSKSYNASSSQKSLLQLENQKTLTRFSAKVPRSPHPSYSMIASAKDEEQEKYEKMLTEENRQSKIFF
ncbi:hypothetical protein Tco_0530659 [Tanacetum coccineum]